MYECGWFCFSNSVPMVHRWMSHRHFTDCLTNTAVGSRMSSAMRAHVFDVWYSQDLAVEAGDVWSRFQGFLLVFFVTSICVAITFTCGWSWLSSSPRYYGGYYNAQYPVQSGYARGPAAVPRGEYYAYPPQPVYAQQGIPPPPTYNVGPAQMYAKPVPSVPGQVQYRPSAQSHLYYRGGA